MNKNTIFLMWPGGVWKSTVWPILADKLWYSLIDLDEVHAERHWNITKFVKQYWYELYRQNNIKVLESVLSAWLEKTITVLSWWLVLYYPCEKLHDIWTCITMLPSPDIAASLEVILDRQSKRDFFINMATEEEKSRKRILCYQKVAERIVYTMNLTPEEVAEKIIGLLV